MKKIYYGTWRKRMCVTLCPYQETVVLIRDHGVVGLSHASPEGLSRKIMYVASHYCHDCRFRALQPYESEDYVLCRRDEYRHVIPRPIKNFWRDHEEDIL